MVYELYAHVQNLHLNLLHILQYQNVSMVKKMKIMDCCHTWKSSLKDCIQCHLGKFGLQEANYSNLMLPKEVLLPLSFKGFVETPYVLARDLHLHVKTCSPTPCLATVFCRLSIPYQYDNMDIGSTWHGTNTVSV